MTQKEKKQPKSPRQSQQYLRRYFSVGTNFIPRNNHLLVCANVTHNATQRYIAKEGS